MSAQQCESSTPGGAPNVSQRANEWLREQYKAYLGRKRSIGAVDSAPSDPRLVQSRVQVDPPLSLMPPSVHAATSASLAVELDEFFNSITPRAYFADVAAAYSAAVHVKNLHHMVFIDSQASQFVVPSSEYLSKVTDFAPQEIVDTANGPIRPECVGEMLFQIADDDGVWHKFHVRDVWVLPGCSRILYSQAVMNRHGVTHRLDEGYILMPGGQHKTVMTPSYAIEVTFITDRACAARSLPTLQTNQITKLDHGADSRASIPQQLL